MYTNPLLLTSACRLVVLAEGTAGVGSTEDVLSVSGGRY